MEAANATSSVLVFLDRRFDTDNERAVRNDMDGFLMPVSCVRVSCAASDSSGEAVSGQSAGASGSYGSLSLFTRPSRSLMMRVA